MRERIDFLQASFSGVEIISPRSSARIIVKLRTDGKAQTARACFGCSFNNIGCVRLQDGSIMLPGGREKISPTFLANVPCGKSLQSALEMSEIKPG